MRLVAVAVLAACGSNSPQANQPGPQGTWTCHQIVESCDSMCRTGMCLQACSNEGSQEGGSLHAALIQCAAANRCYDDGCTKALCGPQVDACLADNAGLPPIATTSGPHPPPPHDDRDVPPPPPHDDREAPPHDTKTDTEQQPPPHDDKTDGAALTMAAVTGEWSYGAKTAVGAPDPKTGARRPGTGSGGTLRLNSDGRFERATNVEAKQGACRTEDFHYAVGAWKLDGATLVLAVKQAEASFRDSCHKAKDFDHEDATKDERRPIRMADPKELEVTDDAGELQSYRKR
ncbi:MAG: hypothetical protein ABJE66_18680 [Deltaproteobacteria bacterium]